MLAVLIESHVNQVLVTSIDVIDRQVKDVLNLQILIMSWQSRGFFVSQP